MRDSIIGEEILLAGRPELASSLNRGLASREDISDEDYLARVGFGEDRIADQINRALRERFGADAPAVDRSLNDDDVILAYAFLTKRLPFARPFEDFAEPLPFYGSSGHRPVEAFGILHYTGDKHGALHEQVDVIDYRSHRDFIVRLNSADPADEIILAHVQPERTLLKTFETVDARVGSHQSERLAPDDVLQIPKLDLAIDHQYESLVGRYLENRGFEDYFVAEARQDIRFRLDECGATARSEGVFALKKGPPVGFRVLVFNEPFMLYIKKKDAGYPYFAIWVDNPGVLIEPRDMTMK
jgi:hypothetical protein